MTESDSSVSGVESEKDRRHVPYRGRGFRRKFRCSTSVRTVSVPTDSLVLPWNARSPVVVTGDVGTPGFSAVDRRDTGSVSREWGPHNDYGPEWCPANDYEYHRFLRLNPLHRRES